MTVEHTSKLAWASACALSLLGGCATEIQEPPPYDSQGLASMGGSSGAGGSGGSSDGKAGSAGTEAGGTPNSAGAAGTTGGTSEAGSGGIAGSGGTSEAGGGGGGGNGGSGGMAGAGGMSGAGGKGGSGGMAGAGGNGGSGGMPNPCGKTQLKISGATASSTENDTFPASKAYDGDAGTRWASAQSEPQWIYFDLGQVAHVSRVLISWETAYATNYRIEIAQAAAGPWTSIFQESAGNGAMDDITNLTPHNGRYVRLYGNTRSTAYGFSVWEFSVFGDLDETCK